MVWRNDQVKKPGTKPADGKTRGSRVAERATAALRYQAMVAAYYFPRAQDYARHVAASAGAVREPTTGLTTFFTERHLQCVWFDERLRPALTTHEGEPVVVEDPGVWNLEEGPDFLGAVLRVGPDRRRLAGDVEAHIHPADWKHHGHAADPRYQRVRVHFTYFPGPIQTDLLPPGTVHIACKQAMAANPFFSFDNIDVALYPHAARGTPPPCQHILAKWDPDRRAAVLEAAGEERLRRKAERLAAAIQEKGANQALYEDVLCALGYKHNKTPFRLLAERLTHADLMAATGQQPEVAYALLMGVAGLLPEKSPAGADEETRGFVRQMWDIWWKHRERWADRILPRAAWHLGGLRPANHPARRLMAAAQVFCRTAPAESWMAMAAQGADLVEEQAGRWLSAPARTYWSQHVSLGGRKSARPTELIGPERAQAILINVLIPFLAAANRPGTFRHQWLRQLPAENGNSLIRQTALNLFGPDHSPTLYRHGLRQQGLLQIFHDFCLNDRSRCAACSLPRCLKDQTISA